MAQSHFTLVRLLRHIFFRLNTRFHRIQNFLQNALSFGSVFSDLSCGLTPNATSVVISACWLSSFAKGLHPLVVFNP